MASTVCVLWFLAHLAEIDATCYLVMMIVFITPTANNVMVMVELSGSSSKEGMARLIGWQYAVSPVVLRLVLCVAVISIVKHFVYVKIHPLIHMLHRYSIVLSAVVSLASCHFDQSPVCST